jgi:hypothetical protein
MRIDQVDDLLAIENLRAPDLNVLIPNENNYSALLMQPMGQIDVSNDGVQHHDSGLAQRQFGRFLDDARTTHADLVITPEYSMPWESLVNALKAGAGPEPGKLWVLGCESIKYSELEDLKQDLAPLAKVLYEDLPPDPQRFINPLAYVFVAPPNKGDGDEGLVVLVQFKTYPMGDGDHFETNHMQRGTCIYQFGGIGQRLKLVSLICSDAFAFRDDDAEAIYDRALVIHIQLNPNPREKRFRRYRESLFAFQGDQTEIICLNWAKDVHHWSDGQETPWNNISASAWYLRPDKFDDRDATLCVNHQRGLYYTWLKPFHVHALFFNFEPATYLLEATKVAHIGVPAVISRRRGPQLTRACVWDNAASVWTEQETAECGFSAVADESGPAKAQIKHIADNNPIEAERVLALCAGKIDSDLEWYHVRRLDSCVISESETILRITFCQDNEGQAPEFRVARMRRCRNLWDILTTEDCLPPALADFKDGFRLEWSQDFPHQNAISAKNQRATVIYMGEEASDEQIEATVKNIAEKLRRSFPNTDESQSAKQRLAVWYRENGVPILFDPHRYVNIDQADDVSEFDIGREQ